MSETSHVETSHVEFISARTVRSLAAHPGLVFLTRCIRQGHEFVNRSYHTPDPDPTIPPKPRPKSKAEIEQDYLLTHPLAGTLVFIFDFNGSRFMIET